MRSGTNVTKQNYYQDYTQGAYAAYPGAYNQGYGYDQQAQTYAYTTWPQQPPQAHHQPQQHLQQQQQHHVQHQQPPHQTQQPHQPQQQRQNNNKPYGNNPKQFSKNTKDTTSIHCDICELNCVGQEAYNSHMMGRKHAAQARKKAASEATQTPADNRYSPYNTPTPNSPAIPATSPATGGTPAKKSPSQSGK